MNNWQRIERLVPTHSVAGLASGQPVLKPIYVEILWPTHQPNNLCEPLRVSEQPFLDDVVDLHRFKVQRDAAHPALLAMHCEHGVALGGGKRMLGHAQGVFCVDLHT
jgi:hypothetical protein